MTKIGYSIQKLLVAKVKDTLVANGSFGLCVGNPCSCIYIHENREWPGDEAIIIILPVFTLA